MWFVYILKCSDDTLYTGITNDLNKRLLAHNSNNLGAKYTRGRRPVKLVYQQKCMTRSDASTEEIKIKKLSKLEKLTLIKKKRRK